MRVAALAWRSSALGTHAARPAEPESVSDRRCTTRGAADLLGIGERAVRKAISGGALPAENVGGRWLIDREDVEQYRAKTRRT
ncbi:helix-turn-helix domain-containing protein [Microbacterium binotii]|uniref:helix-turn-helix domain-containing protein n=1 Tax=Microbacterium binotii TaxID=462710 RepID=UPI003AF29D4D